MKDDAVYLRHVQECIARIEQYTEAGRSAFMASTLVQDGVIRNLQTLGQSALQLSDALKSAHPEVDWKSIVGNRRAGPARSQSEDDCNSGFAAVLAERETYSEPTKIVPPR